MKIRTLHRILGLTLLIPLLAWAVTGFVFFLKPGYAGAYEMLSPKTYPLNAAPAVTPDPQWLEYRYVRTVLGDHLLARTAQGWQHLDPATLQAKPKPNEDEINRLVADAIAVNPQRYGQVESVTPTEIKTDTGITIAFNWQRLSLQQKGADTDRIDRLYKIHYLQWTGISAIDKALGFIGLSCVLLLTLLGVRLAWR
jgi:PepSY-associated TM region